MAFITLDRRLRALVVYDSVMYNRGHNVRRWAESLERRFTRNAKAFAPVGRAPKGPGKRPPGALKRSIRGGVERRGPRRLVTTITIGVNYAQFVTRGTGPFIQGHGKNGMKIYWAQLGSGAYPKAGHKKGSKRPGSSLYHYKMLVRGQAPNNFLDRAARLTATRHPSIRGYTPQGIAGRY